MATPAEVAGAVERATGERPASVSLLKGVGNNVVARVDMAAGPLAAKIYFSHPDDPRDRLGVEHGTLSFLWANGVRRVPRPVLIHRGENLGLYEFIAGEKIAPGGVGPGDTEALAEFLGDLWDQRVRPGAENLAKASEHGLSIGEYEANVEARFERLRRAVDGGSSRARAFVAGPLAEGLTRVKAFVQRGSEGMDLERSLAPALRTLSPADHGFHNALRREGQLVFLDFEYAGWDDPAHVIANACLQPAVPMPEGLKEAFVRRASARFGGGRDLARRLSLLYPLLAYKWALIMMNEFMPVAGLRRAFAGADVEERKAAQLNKASAQLAAAEETLSDDFFLRRI